MSMNAIHTYGIVTNDFKLARDTLDLIVINRTDINHYCLNYYNLMVEFNDGTRWMWIKPTDMSRGYRLHKAMFDKRLTFEEFKFVWLQNCSAYCEGYEWI